jgi:hypothetical protein
MLAIAVVAVVAVRWLPSSTLMGGQAPAMAQSRPAEAEPQGAKPDERFGALPSRAPLGAPRGTLFEAPPPPKPAAPPPAEARPTPPALPYRVAGTLTHDGVKKVVLVRGERVLTVEEGDTLEGGYRVEAINNDEITLVYVPLDTRERLAVASAAAAATPAASASTGGSLYSPQLRWEGPEQVRSGNVFNLALKVTSSEPLRAAPLRLSYDAHLLEPVAVRPGKLFGADASFSYRIDPSGSIVVSAAGAAAAATDAELVIVTFKPMRPAPVAEVRLASLQLQRAAGAAAPSEPIAAFRTAITP